jgi:hypothetical protein
MSATLTIRDETPGAKSFREWSLEVLTERLTVRQLIKSRVYQEVQDFNRQQTGEFQGLIQPTDAERTLNGVRLRRPRPIDWKEQFERAVEAFESNQVLVLINDRQAESLDEEFEVAPGTQVSFLRLTLLVGG